MAVLRGRRDAPFDATQRRFELATRGRTARRIRGHLRRLEPVSVITPRWSSPQSFLEDLALDLAVGEPTVACRTVSLRPLQGRSVPEAWNFLLRVMGDLCGPEFCTRPVPQVCDRRGFFYATDALLDLAQEESPTAVALLVHGTEHLPYEALADLADAWARYSEQARDSRRCTILMAGALETPAFHLNVLPPIELCDYGEAEAAAALVGRLGVLDVPSLQRAVLLSGGVPAILQAIARAAETTAAPAAERPIGFRVARLPASATRRVPTDPAAVLKMIGPLADEMRASVATSLINPDIAGRFYTLAEQGPQVEDEGRDSPLLLAGLARRIWGRAGGPHVELRSPTLPLLAS
jgi:hypothetical protein